MSHLIAHDRERRESANRGRADLYVHTLHSDGGQSPGAVVRAAARRVDVVGITDHDRVGGALRARQRVTAATCRLTGSDARVLRAPGVRGFMAWS